MTYSYDRTAADRHPITIQTVEKFINGQRTYMDLDDHGSNYLNYSTRENGDVDDERPGREDVQHAKALRKALEAEFGAAIKVGVEIIDEWVHLDVRLSRLLEATLEFHEVGNLRVQQVVGRDGLIWQVYELMHQRWEHTFSVAGEKTWQEAMREARRRGAKA